MYENFYLNDLCHFPFFPFIIRTEKHGPSINGNERLSEMLQETMVTQLQEMEERMMRSLEKRLDGFEKLLELRLNRMEVIVEQLASSHRNTQSQQSEGQHGYHGD